MRGYGDPADQTPTGTTPATATNWFGWGYGDPDPDTLHTAASSGLTWAGVEVEYAYGDPVQLEAGHVLVVSDSRQPDDGGSILELEADWPSVGPWRIKLVDSFTDQTYTANAPLLGKGLDCETNVVETEVFGTLVSLPGRRLRFVLPVVPTGRYDVRVEAAPPSVTSPLVVSEAIEVIHRTRATETYTYRRRFPDPYSLGTRDLQSEDLLGIEDEALGDKEIS